MSDQHGAHIQLEEGVAAGVTMPITNGDLADTYHLSDGSEAPTWHFDTQNGTWIETGVGVVSEDEDGDLTFTFNANEFSWWNYWQILQNLQQGAEVVETAHRHCV